MTELSKEEKARLRAEATAVLLNRHRTELQEIYKELCAGKDVEGADVEHWHTTDRGDQTHSHPGGGKAHGHHGWRYGGVT